jgi:hypothetical protein
MKIAIAALILFNTITIGFANKKSTQFPVDTVRILVLPPYDEIANAGISPDTQKIIESALTRHRHLSVIPFPFKILMGVPYQMVFDKKYCKAILDKVDCDVILMTQLITDNERKQGSSPWAYKIRIYNVKTDRQRDSIHGEDLNAETISVNIGNNIEKLIKDIYAMLDKG